MKVENTTENEEFYNKSEEQGNALLSEHHSTTMSTNSSEFNGGGLENGSTTSSCYPSSTLFHSSTKQTPSLDYLQLLLKDKHQLAAFPNVFTHVDRLIDEEINRVRVAIFQCEFTKEPLQLPEPIGEMTVRQEKVFVPTKEYPDYNFVGRILGPRGMTAKQLEQETSCKIMVRGKGSMRDKKKEEQNRGKPNWEHLNDELHVLIQCEDTSNRIELKISRAIEEVKKLLVPAAEDDDELKKKQLMELALINRAYKNGDQTPNSAGGNSKNGSILQTSLLNSSLNSSIHSSPGLVGAPLIMPPTMAGRTPQHSFTHLPLATNNPMAQALAFNGAFGINGSGVLNASSTASMPTLLTASAPIQPMFSVAGAVGATAPTVIDYSQLFLNQVPQQPLDLTQIQLQQQQQQLAFMLQAQASSATTAGIFGDYGVLAGTAGGPMVHSRSIGHQVREQSHPYATPSATASANKKDR